MLMSSLIKIKYVMIQTSINKMKTHAYLFFLCQLEFLKFTDCQLHIILLIIFTRPRNIVVIRVNRVNRPK